MYAVCECCTAIVNSVFFFPHWWMYTHRIIGVARTRLYSMYAHHHLLSVRAYIHAICVFISTVCTQRLRMVARVASSFLCRGKYVRQMSNRMMKWIERKIERHPNGQWVRECRSEWNISRAKMRQRKDEQKTKKNVKEWKRKSKRNIECNVDVVLSN